MPKFLKTNKKQPVRNANAAVLMQAKKNVYWQAGLAVTTIVLTIVIAFAMTSAWYTNIVQTSGLTFEAEAWGFDGDIKVSGTNIVAGPGDDGLIHLEVENDSENIISVGVNVAKVRNEISDEMARRLYVYVDTQMTRNGETMDRVYLNNKEGYNYTLFSNGKLTLTDSVYNDAQLKWHWVYDVLGYYVYGTEIESVDGTTVNVEEYLRPIEYDYDEATTTFKTINGRQVMVVDTVDGKTKVNDFLKELSKTDGYEGTIDIKGQLPTGYYPVDVKEDADGNRYGVYAYLCNFAEIESEIQLDTAIGETAKQNGKGQESKIRLTISAQKNKNSVVNVTTLASLYAAIEQGEADVIQLSSDITVPAEESLTIAKGQRVMLDLNNYTIKSEHEESAVRVEEGASLTMINGTIDGAAAETTNGVYAIGGEAMLSNVDIVGFDVGLRVSDDAGKNDLDSRVHLSNCKVEAKNYGIIVMGNGSKSEHLTQLVLENCEITSDSVGISGNGTATKGGTDIQIIKTKVTGTADMVTTGIFHPQSNGKLTIYDSEITGYTGLAIKGGEVSVIDSEIYGTGEKQEPEFKGSGCADTGDAIYIETNYEGSIRLEISGDSIIQSANSFSLQVYKPDAPNVIVRIISGTFNEGEEIPDEYIADGSEKTGEYGNVIVVKN